MCGITGIISEEKITDSDKTSVEIMNSNLIHRGPNSSGFFGDENIFVGMRRLSIIDIKNGDQPLWNEDKTISLVANGEIYNFIEIRANLTALGHYFKTNSDCETIIHSYEEYGENFLEKLQGMFAFCLYDRNKKRVIIARDRLGEKPLYLIKNESKIVFSSEFKSIATYLKNEEKILSKDSINLYFHYQYVPEPYTMIDKIKKLEKGSMLIIDLQTFLTTEKKYWDFSKSEINQKENSDLSKNINYKELILSKFNDIEKIIVRSDVPIGICLSGGIDSSIIAILSKKYSDKKVHAFSVGYPNRPENDERVYANELAKNLSMTSHNIEITKKDFIRDFNSLIKSSDDPVADIAGYGYYRLSKAAKENNIPVLFAGFGGDELFWGYDWVTKSVIYNKLKARKTKGVLFFKLLKYYRPFVKKNPLSTLFLIFKMTFRNGYIFYELTPGFFSTQNNHKNIFTKNFRSSVNHSLPKSFFENTPSATAEISSCLLLYDLWMVGNCTPLGDRLGMTHSVEIRLPFLNHKLIEDVISLRKKIPGDYLLGYKYWLIEAFKNILPKEIISRKKMGFTPPTTEWISELVEKNKADIIDGYLVKNKIIKKSFVEKIVQDIKNNKDFLYKVIVLEKWITECVSDQHPHTKT